jgi:hypothetical protein
VTVDRERCGTDATPFRTAAATAARRLAKAERLCGELVARLDTLPEPMLAALVACVMAECQRRSGTAPEAAPATTSVRPVVAVQFSDRAEYWQGYTEGQADADAAERGELLTPVEPG